MDKYRIEFSNKSKAIVEVGYRTFNSQTTLTLTGKNTVNYGKELNSNFYHLLESFCNDIPPANPIEGQTWYDTEAKTLKVFDSEFWVPVGYAKQPIVPDDAVSPSLLELTTSQYLKRSGGDMTGRLLLKPTSFDDDDNAAVTKYYVDTIQPKETGDLISLYGNVGTPAPTGAILTRGVGVSQPNQAATKSYADSTVPHIIKTVDQDIVVSSGSATGKINTVTFAPANQIHIFGTANVSASVPFVDIVLPVGLINECVLANVTGAVDATVDISAYTTLDAKSDQVLRIVKHGTLTKAVSVNFFISGLIA